jgi:hypothetical protein
MLSSDTAVLLNAVLRAFFRAAMPEAPILPESSTDTMMLGAGSRPPLPAGTWANGNGLASPGWVSRDAPINAHASETKTGVVVVR